MRFYPIPNADLQVAQKALLLFQRETQLLARLNHPHILPLFDYGQVIISGNSCLSFVMPLCLGGSLATWLRQRGGTPFLSPSEVSAILLQVADALQCAHRQRITHLNIKAENLLIASYDTSSPPNILLADFGVATLAAAVADGKQRTCGSPIAMAPEQWEGHPVAASDQYALAILAYSLLTGRPPYIGNAQQLMYQHLHAQPQPSGHFVPYIPSAIDAILLRALAKQPGERFDSVLSFAQTFAQALGRPSASLTMPSKEQGAAGLLQRFGKVSASGEARRPYKDTVPPTASSFFVTHSPSPRRVMSVVLLLFAVLILTSSILLSRLSIAPQAALVSKNTAAVHVALTPTTMKAVPDPYPPHVGTLVFSDTMSSDSFNWTTGSTNDATCLFSNGTYQVIGKHNGAINPCLGTGPLFSNYHNFVFEVDMMLISGTGGGIRFRISSVGSYNVLLYQDGHYVLTSADSAGNYRAKLLSASAGPAMKRGLQQTSILALVASGTQIDVYVNHIHIGSTHDSFSSQGAFGLVADQVSQVAFSNAQLWTW
jgi:serine/threonine protein kinase